jgi:adenylate cyclase
MQIRPRLKQLPPVAASLVLALLMWIQITFPQAFETARHWVFDAYMAARPAAVHAPITVVSIDETSLADYGPWPWSESQLAALVDALNGLGASIAGLAFIPTERVDSEPLFPETAPVTTGLAAVAEPLQSSTLGASLTALPSVVGFALAEHAGSDQPPPRPAGLATVGDRLPQLASSLPKSLLPSAASMQSAAGMGALNAYPDRDGRIRRVPLLVQMSHRLYPSLPAELLRLAAGETGYLLRTEPGRGIDAPLLLKVGQRVIGLNDNGEIWLHYAPREALHQVSASTVLRGGLSRSALDGRIALIGVAAPGVGAMMTSPLGEQLAPAEVHAQVLAQLMVGSHPWRPSWARAAEVGFGAVGALLLIGISLWRQGFWLVVPGALLVVTVAATAFQLFAEQQLLLDPLSPVLTISAVYLTLALSGYLVAERERRWIQQAFSSYLSPTLARHLMRDPAQLKLGGERRQCSFIMTDLADFTPLVERFEPEALVDLLNRYLDRLVEVVFAHQGTLDRIVGDAVSVRFSAPVTQPDHAQRALDCALAIDHSAQAFAEEMRAAGIPFGETRIGVHSGEVIVGNFGGRRHLDYRAFGDPINTAARLETANKVFGTRLIISAATLAHCARQPATRPIGELLLKGKQQPVASFTPLTETQIRSGLADLYSRAYVAMANQHDDAKRLLEACAVRFPSDALSRFHRQRLQSGGTGIRFAP